MKNMDLATELDASINVIWNKTVGMSPRVEEGLELGWKVGLIDVLCQLVEVLWIPSF